MLIVLCSYIVSFQAVVIAFH